MRDRDKIALASNVAGMLPEGTDMGGGARRTSEINVARTHISAAAKKPHQCAMKPNTQLHKFSSAC